MRVFSNLKLRKVLCTVIASTMLMLGNISQLSALASSEPSGWAIEEIARAKQNGLVTSKLTDDYSKVVTREMFCELVVKLYDKLSPTKSVEANDIFDDTDNIEVLKAYRSGIVKGVAATEFDPDSSITREAICTMITRCFDIIILQNIPCICAQSTYAAHLRCANCKKNYNDR